MKHWRLITTLFFIATSAISNAQSTGGKIPPEVTNGVEIETKSDLYNQAYLEMADMLDGKTPLSIKRAVFLAEWAYLDGNLNYDEYCTGIDTVAKFLQKFIVANGLQQYKTAGNYALFEYFCRPYSGNGYNPFSYDYEDFGGTEDLTKLFVTKVMRTHSGQCRSLPMYYKVLAEAIGAEAYLSFAPQHLFIRHRDEMDPNKWVNVELTTRSLSREVFYIERFGITDNAIRNKVYMYPLTDKETVAFLMSEMLMLGYLRKYDYAYDDLMLLCATKSAEYYPQNVTALQNKANCVNVLLMKHLESNGCRMDDEARRLDDWWYEIKAEIEALGWSEMDYDLYEKLLRDTWDSMKKDGVDEETIRSEMKRENRSPVQYNTN